MIIRVWLHLEDGGDGSAVPHPYPTEELAEKAAAQEMKKYGQALCDNVVSLDLQVSKYENPTKTKTQGDPNDQ